MFCGASLVIFIAAGVSAAPYFPDYSDFHLHSPSSSHFGPYYGSVVSGRDIFDARKLWADINREMMSIERIVNYLHSRFPSIVSSVEYVGNTYQVTIPLSGFDENEITVKAKDSYLMVQAVHKGDVSKNYVDVRTLPKNLDPNGTWTYDGKVLVIVFPIKKSTDDTENTTGADSAEDDTKVKMGGEENAETTTIFSEIEEADRKTSREEMEPNQKEDNSDADVGLKIKSNVDTEIETNAIYTEDPISYTTYSVNVNNNEIDFVPVKY